MWDAMRNAAIGWPAATNPLVGELEEICSDLAGMEAAVVVDTGSLANLVALLAHACPGDQIVLDSESHILWSEECGFASIAGLAARPLVGVGGHLQPDEVEAAITESRFSHRPQTGLLSIENTHNFSGGKVVRPEQMAALISVASRHNVPVHVDGARVFNACVALSRPLKDLTAGVSSITLNLTKGLSCPAGAVLCGDREFISAARRELRRFGGDAYHKAGLWAAAGIVALNTMVTRLEEDHRRARELGEALAASWPAGVTVAPVETNIVLASSEWASDIVQGLSERGLGSALLTRETVRFVTHRHFDDAALLRAREIVAATGADVATRIA